MAETDVKNLDTATVEANDQTAQAVRKTAKAKTATQNDSIEAARLAELKAEAAEHAAQEARKKADDLAKEAKRLNPKKLKSFKAPKAPTFAECNNQYFKTEDSLNKELSSKKNAVKKAIDKIYGNGVK